MTAEPVRNGSTPISFSRVSALGASFVCSVERTKWPVRAASIAIFAVSASRISPTITTSGSERRIERSAAEKVSPARRLICTWLRPARRYSTGSSTVMMLISGPVDLVQRRVEGRRLTGAGRPGDEQRAGRLDDDLLEDVPHLVGEAELRERRRPLRLVEEAHDDPLALDRRQDGDADVEQAARCLRVQRDAAVLRLAPLGDVELGEHLQARRHAGREPLRDPLQLVEDAVDAEADDERVVLRIEVDVARPVLGGLEDDRVDEPDERRVGDAVVGLEVVALRSSSAPSSNSSSTSAARSQASEARSRRLSSSSISSAGATPISSV